MLLDTATTTLLTPFDLEAGKLERVFGTLAARKVDYADLYFQYSRYEGWSLEEGIVKTGSFNIEQGVGVRAVSGEKTAFAYSDEISFDALQEFGMRGSAAQVEMTGTLDLARETQDLKVRIIPSLGDSAAAALAFFNPLLIFPALVADRVLKNPLGHIFSFEYAVTGTWAAPAVKRTSADARALVPNDSR